MYVSFFCPFKFFKKFSFAMQDGFAGRGEGVFSFSTSPFFPSPFLLIFPVDEQVEKGYTKI